MLMSAVYEPRGSFVPNTGFEDDVPISGFTQKDFTNAYNTELTEDEEAQFQTWAKANNRLGDLYDYDMRGAWKAGATQAENGHFPDTFKKPNHPTFSVESKYSSDDLKGGEWKNVNGKMVFRPGHELSASEATYLKKYFNDRERGVKLDVSGLVRSDAFMRKQFVQSVFANPNEPSLFEGFTETWRAIPASVLSTVSAGIDAISALPIRSLATTDEAKAWLKGMPDNMNDTAQRIREYRDLNFGVNSYRAGAATQVIHGLIETLPKAAIYSTGLGLTAGALAFGSEYGINRMQELKAQGVDTKTAAIAGAASFFGGAVGLRLPPALGPNRIMSAIYGGLTNAVVMGAELQTINWVLKNQNYDSLAKSYKLNVTDTAIATGLGAFMGGAFWRGPKTKEQVRYEAFTKAYDTIRDEFTTSLRNVKNADGSNKFDAQQVFEQARLNANAVVRLYEMAGRSADDLLKNKPQLLDDITVKMDDGTIYKMPRTNEADWAKGIHVLDKNKRVSVVPIAQTDSLSLPDLKTKILSKVGDGIKNDDSGFVLQVGSNDIGKWTQISGVTNSQKLFLISQISGKIDELLKTATFVESHADKKKNPSVQGIHHFASAIEFGGKTYRIDFTVRDYNDKYLTSARTHHVTGAEISQTPAPNGAPTTGIQVVGNHRANTSQSAKPASTIIPTEITLSHLLNSVNPYKRADGKYVFDSIDEAELSQGGLYWNNPNDISSQKALKKRNYLEQKLAVRNKYFGTEQWLKAPNGKETKLNEDQWLLVRTKTFKDWFGDWENDPKNASKIVDENGEPKPVYHGTQRLDRIGDTFRKDRATSGPMAFFTDDISIAENYSKSKSDTSISREWSGDYKDAFVVPSGSYEIKLANYWRSLSSAKRAEITKLAGEITQDEEGNFYRKEGNTKGSGGFDWNLKESRGNALEALEAEWLDSGNLFNEEGRFLEVLKLAGLNEIKFKDPNYTEPGVVAVFMNIRNPLVTTSIPKKVVRSLESATRKAQKEFDKQDHYSADGWDKSNRPPEEWLRSLFDDIENSTTVSWTSIPDYVTGVLKRYGYDGISDNGGKYSPLKHKVYIPFEPNQVKTSVEGKNFTYSKDFDSFLMQSGNGSYIGLFDPKTNGIGLTPYANISTFSHEIGHWYLENFFKLASEGEVSVDFAADIKALMNQFGLKSLDEWRGLERETKERIHEQFSSWIEQYLSEGKSQNAELRSVLQRFKEWLIRVYENVLGESAKEDGGIEKSIAERYKENYGSELPPLSEEVRKILDRAYADRSREINLRPTNDQTAAARTMLAHRQNELRTNAFAEGGATPAERAETQRQGLIAQQTAIAQMLAGENVDVSSAVSNMALSEGAIGNADSNFGKGFVLGADSDTSTIVVLQNRNRNDSVVSTIQINDIASKPQYGLTSFSRDTTQGAPIVSYGKLPDDAYLGRQDYVVDNGERIPVQYAVMESDSLQTSNFATGANNPRYGQSVDDAQVVAGNGRVIGLRESYRRGTGKQYQADMAADSSTHGIKHEVIQGMQSPVLVRIMPTEKVSTDFVKRSNRSNVMGMDVLEKARQDAPLIRTRIGEYTFNEDGTPTTDTAMKFIGDVGEITELKNLLTDDGRVKDSATKRINAAVFYEAYRSDALTKLFDDPDVNIKRVLNAMTALAPKVIQIREASKGTINLANPFVEGANAVRTARKEGTLGKDVGEQSGLFSSGAELPFSSVFTQNANSEGGILRMLNPLLDWTNQRIAASNDPMFSTGSIDLADVAQELRRLQNTQRKANGMSELPDVDMEGIRASLAKAQEVAQSVQKEIQMKDPNAVAQAQAHAQEALQTKSEIDIEFNDLLTRNPESVISLGDGQNKTVTEIQQEIQSIQEQARTDSLAIGEAMVCILRNRGI